MNRKLGMYSSIVTLSAVIGFSVSMFLVSSYTSYLSSLFIAWGFVPMICSFTAISKSESKAAGYTAAVFSAVYAAIISLVYFAQLTTVHLTKLSSQASVILDYQNLGSLFFSYDLLGYAFMALSTFFIALTINVEDKKDRWLKVLLLIHGIFSVSCILMPMLGVFKAGMKGSYITGMLVLEFWCAYFIPVCIFSFLYFKKQE